MRGTRLEVPLTRKGVASGFTTEIHEHVRGKESKKADAIAAIDRSLQRVFEGSEARLRGTLIDRRQAAWRSRSSGE